MKLTGQMFIRTAQTKPFVCVPIITLILLLSSCVGGGSGLDLPTPVLLPPNASPIASATPLIQGGPSNPGNSTGLPLSSNTDQIVESATNMLAQTLGVDPSKVLLLSILPAQWPDSSLGCPQGGQTYAQVVTAGYLISFNVDGKTYEVHSDQGQNFIVCTGNSAGGTPTPPDPVAAEFILQAKEMLSAQLGIPPENVVVISSVATDWSDESLGCNRGGTAAAPVIVSGYRIIVAVEDQLYEFHTSFDQIILCENPTE